MIITKYRNRNEKTTQDRIRRILTKNKKSMNSLLLHVFIMVEPTPLLDPVPNYSQEKSDDNILYNKKKTILCPPPKKKKKKYNREVF